MILIIVKTPIEQCLLILLSQMPKAYPTIKIGYSSQKGKEKKNSETTERHFFPYLVRSFNLILKLVGADAGVSYVGAHGGCLLRNYRQL